MGFKGSFIFFTTKDTKEHVGFFNNLAHCGVLIHHALDAVFEMDDIEVDQIAKTQTGYFEIGQKLRLVERGNCIYRF